jgi:hypothetical protein
MVWDTKILVSKQVLQEIEGAFDCGCVLTIKQDNGKFFLFCKTCDVQIGHLEVKK